MHKRFNRVSILIAQHKEGVLDKAHAIFEELKKAGYRVKIDDSDKANTSPSSSLWTIISPPMLLVDHPQEVSYTLWSWLFLSTYLMPGDPECEGEVKYVTGGASTRCLIEDEEMISDKCIWCGKPAKHMAYWGKSY